MSPTDTGADMRMYRFLVLATAATGGVLLAPPAASAHALHAKVELRADTVSVTAYFNDNFPAEDAECVLLDAGGAEVVAGKADENGRWSFPRPAPGQYTLKVKCFGHVARVPLAVDGAGGAPTEVRTGPPLNKAVGLGAGVVLLLGVSAASWFIRRRRWNARTQATE